MRKRKREREKKGFRAAIRVRFKRAGNCRIIYFPLFKITRHASFKAPVIMPALSRKERERVGDVGSGAAARHVRLKMPT